MRFDPSSLGYFEEDLQDAKPEEEVEDLDVDAFDQFDLTFGGMQ